MKSHKALSQTPNIGQFWEAEAFSYLPARICELVFLTGAAHVWCYTIMDSIYKFRELEKYFEKADFMDVKVFEGKTSLRKFIASMLSYYPWWIVLLYRIRKLLVGILGLVKHEEPEALPKLKPEDVSFTAGENVTFFIVRCAKENLFWVSETLEDKHLKAYFGVVQEPLGKSFNRFYVFTTVFYKHWTGPIYFNIIRPFHHLVVSRMAKYGLAH